MIPGARSGKSDAITNAAAVEIVEWPDGYEGNGGVEKTVVSVGSALMGRRSQCAYL
jgi:hypothetical protein